MLGVRVHAQIVTAELACVLICTVDFATSAQAGGGRIHARATQRKHSMRHAQRSPGPLQFTFQNFANFGRINSQNPHTESARSYKNNSKWIAGKMPVYNRKAFEYPVISR
jgi:hypothetical protein